MLFAGFFIGFVVGIFVTVYAKRDRLLRARRRILMLADSCGDDVLARHLRDLVS